MSVAIALFTRDLRVHDNPVLHAAAKAARRIVPLFVLDTAILSGPFNRPNRAAFLADCLADLDHGLRERGAALVIRKGDVVAEVCRIAEEQDADEIHIAADVSGYAARREAALRKALAPRELFVHEATITVVPPGEVSPAGKDHFAVFTPYFRRWLEAPKRKVLRAPSSLRLPDVDTGEVPERRDLTAGEIAPELPRGGERAARRLLRSWLADVADYPALHDDLATDGTSRLSPHLHFGSLSPTELVSKTAKTTDFVRQVAWRDFHHQVLAANPAAALHDYRTKHDRWRRSAKDLRAWREGRTGFPIVDAGMRQLLREGWMHNRARLIVGSFLCKTLYLDWRLGARHFTDLLVDADIASNQLNWQWVAGTGTDSRPNRVLNPLRQALRYDPDGDYVRRYVPELAGIAGAAVHEPWRLPDEQRAGLGYPPPMVDLAPAAARFREARGT